MSFVRLALFAFAALYPLAVQGCADTLEGDEDDDHETEAMGASSDAITSSGVECKTERMQAYDKGQPSSIDVIKIGGKRVSKPTGHAFLRMQQAADKAGVKLQINSGFRTNDEQQYFYNCYKTKSCNSGNLAAKPGYSNHQNGRALDLTTSSWLTSNAAKFGFKRTVPSEPWHYEFSSADPGGPCSSAKAPSAAGSAGTEDDTTLAPEAKPAKATTTTTTAGSSQSSASKENGGASCGSDGDCNPGNDGSGLVCESGRCVGGCRSNAHCPGVTTCSAAGRCE